MAVAEILRWSENSRTMVQICCMKTMDSPINRQNPDQTPEFARGWALFLDVDGTLLDLADHPDQVSVSPLLLGIISRLDAHNDGALALISGRPITSLDRLFSPMRFCMAGQHGLERRDYGGLIHRHDMPNGHFREVKDCLYHFAADHPGIIFEDKTSSVAIHYRQAPGLLPELEKTVQACMEEINDDFHLQAGKMVFEIKPRGKDKGTAIAEFVGESPFNQRMPVFIGDDVTDEDGFNMVNELGGHTIKVGAGETRARWRLGDSSAVQNWLASYLDFLINQE